MRFFAFDSASTPVKAGGEGGKVGRPFKTDAVNKLDYAWWGGIKTGAAVHRQFLTVAEGRAEIEKGIYELSVTWDDAARVYVDDALGSGRMEPCQIHVR